MSLPTPKLYYATRRSSKQLMQPALSTVSVNFADQPRMWVLKDHAESMHDEAVSNGQPKRILVTATIMPAPYLRSVETTMQIVENPNTPANLVVLAASENPAEVRATMQTDMSRTASDEEERGGFVKWSEKWGNVLMTEGYHAEAVVLRTRESVWWDFWEMQLPPYLAANIERDGVRVPTAEEELERTVLGEYLFDWEEEEAHEEKEERRPSWEEMGLVKVGEQGFE